MSLLVISPCYYPDTIPAQKMLATARRVGLEPMLYGVGKTQATHGGDSQGYHVIEMLKERRDSHVLACDCADVAFLAGEDEIMARFREFNIGLVVSAEREGVTGLPKTSGELHRQCIEAGGYHAQLNIGLWVAERDYVIYCFEEAYRLYRHKPENPNYSYDSPCEWLMLSKAWGGPEFALDIHCRIFQSMNRVDDDVVVEGKRVLNLKTGTRPAVLHYNGDPTRGAFSAMVDYLMEG